MLIVRAAQVQVLADEHERSFTESLVAGVVCVWPQACAKLRPQQLRERVEHGVQKARFYRLETRSYITRYVSTVFALVDAFDTDERYP